MKNLIFFVALMAFFLMPKICFADSIEIKPIENGYSRQSDVKSKAKSGFVLYTRANPKITSYLKFDLSALLGKTIDSVFLNIHTTDDSNSGSLYSQNIRIVDTDWGENSLNYINNPLSGSIVGVLSTSNTNSQYQIPIDPSFVQLLTGENLSFSIDSSGKDTFAIFSKETNQGPKLIINYK